MKVLSSYLCGAWVTGSTAAGLLVAYAVIHTT